MKKLTSLLALISLIVLSSCDDCMKTITIPQFYFFNGQSYSRDIAQEVPCDFPDPTEPELIEPPLLGNFSYEVINFTFTPDTGNNSFKLEFAIKLKNGNNFDVTGIPIFTLKNDDVTVSGSYDNNLINSCNQIAANSECTVTYSAEESFDIAMVNSIELINVEYLLTN